MMSQSYPFENSMRFIFNKQLGIFSSQASCPFWQLLELKKYDTGVVVFSDGCKRLKDIVPNSFID
jgi:hypothetical protein